MEESAWLVSEAAAEGETAAEEMAEMESGRRRRQRHGWR